MRTLGSSGVMAVLALLLQGCVPFVGQTRDPAYVGNGPGAFQLPAFTIFQDSAGPLSYRAPAVASGLLREVRGEACQSALTFPVGLVWAAVKAGNTAQAPGFIGAAWGGGGYAAAVGSALATAPNARLVALRADLNTRIILGVWRQQCVRVVASVVPPG